MKGQKSIDSDKWLLCLICQSKSRIMFREDTMLEKFPFPRLYYFGICNRTNNSGKELCELFWCMF